MQNLLSFFSKTNQTHLIIRQEAQFHILSEKNQAKKSQEEIDLFNRLAVQFGVDDVRASG